MQEDCVTMIPTRINITLVGACYCNYTQWMEMCSIKYAPPFILVSRKFNCCVKVFSQWLHCIHFPDQKWAERGRLGGGGEFVRSKVNHNIVWFGGFSYCRSFDGLRETRPLVVAVNHDIKPFLQCVYWDQVYYSPWTIGLNYL